MVGLFELINGLAGKSAFLDRFMIFSAEYLVFILVGVFVYLFFKNRKKCFFVVSAFFASLIVNKFIEAVFYSPRPFVQNLGTQLVSHVADSSFPSDHAIALFSVGFALLFSKYKKSGILFLVLGLLVGFARVFVGIHFPVDVLGSLLVGFIVVSLVYLFFRKRAFQ